MAKRKPKIAKKKAKSPVRAKAPLKKATARKKSPTKKTVRMAPKSAPKPRTQDTRPKTIPKPAQAPSPEKEGPIEITPEIRRLWIRMRQTWVVSYQAFNHSVAMLDDRQANLMYDVVKHSLFKDSHAQILREHPELKELIHTDDDRLCMHDVYERLSYRLDRYEKLPPDKNVYRGMKGRIGRNLPDLEV